MRISHTNRLAMLSVMFLISAAGCHSYTPPAEVGNHVMVFNEDGDACDARRHFAKMTREQFSRQTQEILAAMDAFHADPSCASTAPMGIPPAASKPTPTAPGATVPGATPPKVKKILIFVHGGLNGQDKALRRDEDQYCDIQKAGYFPIFINRNSELISSYGEHLLYVRQGRKDSDDKQLGHVLTAPLYLIGDIGRAVFRAPSVWTHLAGTDFPGAKARLESIHDGQPHWLEDDHSLNAAKYYSRFSARYADNTPAAPGVGPLSISMGSEQTTSRFWRDDTLRYLLTLPAKLLTTPVIDTMGQAAWQNLSRRTVNLFEDPRQIKVLGLRDDQVDELIDFGPPGSLQTFLGRLISHIDSHSADGGYEVTLIGHSMGSMVLNQLLLHNPKLNCKNIVYMAAACSIHDFEQDVIPYLEAHEQTQFYNLCLHPTSELVEAEGFELTPRGSLLLWVDEFLGTPETPLDRTLGRWDNFLPAMYVIPRRLRDRIHVKAFAMTGNGKALDPQTHAPAPQIHGGFTEVSYWEESFWTPLPADDQNLQQLVAQMNARIADLEKRGMHVPVRNFEPTAAEHSAGTGSRRSAPKD